MAKSNGKRGQSAGEAEGDLEWRLAEHYARIRQVEEIDPEVLAAVRTCFERIPGRVPATPATRRVIAELSARLTKVIAVRTPDLHGTPRELDEVIAALSGEQTLGARSFYEGLIALHGQTVLVQRPSRGRWSLLLNKVTDRRAAEHLQLLQETPSFQLPRIPAAERAKRRSAPAPAPEPVKRDDERRATAPPPAETTTTTPTNPHVAETSKAAPVRAEHAARKRRRGGRR